MQEAPIEKTELCDNETKLQCGFLLLQKIVNSQQSLSYSRPYVCSVQGCKHPQFGDKGGLDRHTREVHGSKTYCCPITTCKRHTRGFPRKYNLFEHQKRCHSGTSPGPMSSNLVRNSRVEDTQNGDRTSFSSELAIGGGRIREKLERLYALRMEIDGDIETLKRAVDIMGDS
ncbi:hypothetical protein HYFRA_00012286 [Hymenoscyphus fraxineus]|uniref:C2H2-type domain-containing protein n=1 Tax=Hymenoscyphus fraxineus TaxID=746836 RepID=A0A9N9L491_9HELO|nr:hypothetical protein HYFRA_00012286 [Hymenoscyphus fraxineus]